MHPPDGAATCRGWCVSWPRWCRRARPRLVGVAVLAMADVLAPVTSPVLAAGSWSAGCCDRRLAMSASPLNRASAAYKPRLNPNACFVGCCSAGDGSCCTSSAHVPNTKSNCGGSGCSIRSVPSLSNAAIRAAGSTKSGAAPGRHPVDKIQDGIPGPPVPPTGQRGVAHRLPVGDSECRMQRNPRCDVEVSTACGIRAAGRYR